MMMPLLVLMLAAAPSHCKVQGRTVTFRIERDPIDALGASKECINTLVDNVLVVSACRVFEWHSRVVPSTLRPCGPPTSFGRIALKPIRTECTENGLRFTPAKGDGALVELTFTPEGTLRFNPTLRTELATLANDDQISARSLERISQLKKTIDVLVPSDSANEEFEQVAQLAQRSYVVQLIGNGRYRTAHSNATGDLAERLTEASDRDVPFFVEGPTRFALPPEKVRASYSDELQLRWHEQQPCIVDAKTKQAQCLDLATDLWSTDSSNWSPKLHAQTTEVPNDVTRIRALPGDQWLVARGGQLAIAERCAVKPLSHENRRQLEAELEEGLTIDGQTVVDLNAGGLMRLEDPEKFWPLRDEKKGVWASTWALSASRRWLAGISSGDLVLFEIHRQP